jgi:hypothetical protein
MRIPHSFAIMKAACVVLLLLTLLPLSSHSQSLFDGTWVVVSSKTENAKPISFLVVDGVYRSADRVLKADGKDHEVPVTGYWDTVSVLIVDEHTVEVTSKKAGKAMFTESDAVSEDGNTLTQVVKDMTESKTVTLRICTSALLLRSRCTRFVRYLASLQAERQGTSQHHV